MIRLRDAHAYDAPDIHDLIEKAFGREAEAVLVEELREEGCVLLELVAEAHGRLVGHILFSQLPVVGEGRMVNGAALAPMSVHPDWQRKGIGAALVQMGLEILKDKGIEAVIVLGETAYYTRFGFSPDLAKDLESPYSGPNLMGLELRQGALAGLHGSLRYPRAFGVF